MDWLAAGWLALAVALSVPGMALLALSQTQHWRKVGTTRSSPRAARPLGWSLTLAALAVCILRDGMSLAALIWPMLVAASAVTVALTLAFVPGALRPLARAVEG
ncbi:MAG: DUF3325 domain-containing protein [Pseudomonadota bacterium]